MKIFQFWLIFAVESYRYQRYNAKKAAAKPQMMIRDADGNLMDWHGPHGGHDAKYKDNKYWHGPHGGPRDADGIEAHGHGPHGGHPIEDIVFVVDGKVVEDH